MKRVPPSWIPALLLASISVAGMPRLFSNGAATPASREWVRVYFTSERRGVLEPCGCSNPQVGGIARAGGLFKRIPPTEASVKLDNGDWTEARGRQDQLKAETTAQFFAQQGYAAANLGEKDWALGLDALRDLQSTAATPFVSANVVDAASGQSVFPTHGKVSLSFSDGSKAAVAIIGLLSPEFSQIVQSVNPGLRVIAPEEALRNSIEKVAAQAAFGILLYHGSAAECEPLLRQHPWIRLAIAAHESESPAVQPMKIGDAWIVSIGEEGKYVGEVHMSRGAVSNPTATPGTQPGWTLEQYHPLSLSPEVAENPDTRALMKQYLQKVTEENLLRFCPKQKTPNGDKYAGAHVCADCHKKETKIWKGSKHAHAFQTLIDVGHEADPECVGCHVVGFKYESGFVDVKTTPRLVDMGCENCHLPQHKHAQLPYAYRPPKATSAACKQCHDPDHSPSFDFDKYWTKIRH